MQEPVVQFVIPMAGAGSRFQKAGYKLPKPLIPVLGKPMIQLVVENLTPKKYQAKFVFLVQQAHIERYHVDQLLQRVAPGCGIVPVHGLTEGAACTVLLARDHLDANQPLVIANCDQYVDCSMDAFFEAWFEGDYDGMIMTMKADDPKWSFVGFDCTGKPDRVVEKQVISEEASVGIYGFTRAVDFIRGADAMIAADDRVKNEFYVAPVYNYLVKDGARLGLFNIGSERHGMYGIGIPEDLQYFETLPLARKACALEMP